jgi:hypothetical protein
MVRCALTRRQQGEVEHFLATGESDGLARWNRLGPSAERKRQCSQLFSRR